MYKPIKWNLMQHFCTSLILFRVWVKLNRSNEVNACLNPVWYLFAVGVEKHGVVPVLLVEPTHEVMAEYYLAFNSVQYWGIGGGERE